MLLRSLGRLKLRIMARVRMNKSGKTRGYVTAASLSNQDDDKDKNVTSLHKKQWKTVGLHALHRREMTCFAVVCTTWALDNNS